MTKKIKGHGTYASRAHLQSDRGVPSLVQPRTEPPKRLPAVFFRTRAGNEPVRDWLKGELSAEDRIKVGTDIRAVEIGWPLGMPLCRPLGRGLWEVRTTLQDRIARVIFTVQRGQMVLLHGFIKKSAETPQGDIDLAFVRRKQVEKDK